MPEPPETLMTSALVQRSFFCFSGEKKETGGIFYVNIFGLYFPGGAVPGWDLPEAAAAPDCGNALYRRGAGALCADRKSVV